VEDPFDIGDMPRGLRGDLAAYRAAEEMSVTLGEHSGEIDQYLLLLSYAPAEHLIRLSQRGCRIIFAPTVAHYLVSALADRRRIARGYPPLGSRDREAIVRRYGAEGSVVAAYDEPSDVLVLPYARCGPDKLRSALHELGHAMTWERLAGREAEFAHCLAALPTRIQLHLLCGYDADLATRVHEAFAEGYAMLVCERVAELGEMASELIGILSECV